MGIYWCAVDRDRKEKFEAPCEFSITSPGIFHPDSPFPGMLVMMNSLGYNFELVNDGGWDESFYSADIKDITEHVYQKYIKYWNLSKPPKENMQEIKAPLTGVSMKFQDPCGTIYFTKPNGFSVEIEVLVSAMEEILGRKIAQHPKDKI